MNEQLFEADPRSYALELVDDELVDCKWLLLACLRYLSHDECRDMLDMNELSPRFDDDDDDDDDDDV